MKRAVLLLALLTALAAAGCGGSSGPTETAAAPATEPAPTTNEAAPAATETAPSTMDAAPAGGCGEVQDFPSEGQNHVEEPPPDSSYGSVPPTSGPHYPVPAKWTVFDEEVPQFVLIHNLEHGGIVVQYGPQVSADWIGSILGWVAADPNGIVVAPYAALGDTIALTAWTHLLSCTQFDDAAFSSFRDAYRYNGPELLAEDTYLPENAS